MLIALLLAACIPLRPSDVPPDFVSEPPVIIGLDWLCDPDAERTELVVLTSDWTGGGRLWLTTDGAYVESHELVSVEAASDGSTDRLRLALNHEADFRNVVPNSNTAFTCLSDPTGVVRIYDREGGRADCDFVGPERGESLFVGDDVVPSCDEPARAPALPTEED